MTADIFRIDWYPQKSYMGFSRLDVEQIGMLMQIINLIYIHNGPIDNDEVYIGKSVNLTKGKARKIIDKLIDLNQIYVTEDGKLSQKRCDFMLSDIRERMEENSKNGRKGAKSRWENKGKQEVEDSQAMRPGMASISNRNSKRISTSSPDQSTIFNIDFYLTDDTREKARLCAPGWDQQYLMTVYNDMIAEEKFEIPKHPNSAYLRWCGAFTKGKPP